MDECKHFNPSRCIFITETDDLIHLMYSVMLSARRLHLKAYDISFYSSLSPGVLRNIDSRNFLMSIRLSNPLSPP